MTAPKPGRRSCNSGHHNKLAINQKEKKKDQKKTATSTALWNILI
jgi:hypothetical protein